jgi:ABC-type amino acid transport substrate-binding protein
MKKLSYILILVLFLITGCNDVERNNKIIFCSGIFPPFSYLDENKNFTGFSVDLAKEIAFKLGKEPEFRLLNLQECFPALNNNFADAALNLTKTEERSKNMLFSKIYIKNNFYFILNNKLKFSNLDEAIKNNIIFGSIHGSLENIFLKKYFPDAKILEFDNYPMIFEAFKIKIIDSFVSYDVIIKNFIEKNNIKEYNIFEIDTSKTINLGFSFALNKKNQKLLDQINVIIEEMGRNGEIDSLKAKYELK